MIIIKKIWIEDEKRNMTVLDIKVKNLTSKRRINNLRKSLEEKYKGKIYFYYVQKKKGKRK